MGRCTGDTITEGPALWDMKRSKQPVIDRKEDAKVAEVTAILAVAMMAVMNARRDENMFQPKESRTEQAVTADGVIPPEVAVRENAPKRENGDCRHRSLALA